MQMKLAIAGFAFSVMLAGFPAMDAGAAEDAVAAGVAEIKPELKRFASVLKKELQQALKTGGPLKAIEVCNGKAPEIAARISEETGWDVGRTSLKWRNPDNAPDAWERKVLEDFEKRRARGEKAQAIDYAEIVEQDGRRVLRYMKAIPTGKVCLACHGSNIDSAVRARLDEFYPDDRARGFRLGDIRGAFTVSRPM